MKLSIRKSSSLKAVFALVSAIIAVIIGSWFFYFKIASSDNADAYHALVEAANPINSNFKVSPYKAHQKRRGIQKDIGWVQGSERLQIQLSSSASTLVLDNQESGLEILEKMQDVKCLMQEELYYLLPDGREAVRQPNGKVVVRNQDPDQESSQIDPAMPGILLRQRLRYLEADDATYFYNSDKFVADKVKIYRYDIPSHDIPKVIRDIKPVMSGTAESVVFSFSDRNVNFTAIKLKATFFEQKI